MCLKIASFLQYNTVKLSELLDNCAFPKGRSNVCTLPQDAPIVSVTEARCVAANFDNPGMYAALH